MLRPSKEIDAEIKKLEKALKIPDRWNPQTAKGIQNTIEVLRERLSVKQVEDRYYCDEGDPDYRDGDNEMWSDLNGAALWLIGDAEAPSEGL